ncbi:predicted protein [Plenodomus lingam JN3]|uniref:Predicted protein n=1 Tax=Leptosphaeria maculans (strain JN3 / isolate v23.1.3 / race Av1-4-5-6-7-8) TaxID=985895 RepID=E4ZIC8_LEPMJ|nr:predicted protein [Plenodomus lingam JN3]CBX90789.1 predicted protein [Plenodomus lingam JN3]
MQTVVDYIKAHIYRMTHQPIVPREVLNVLVIASTNQYYYVNQKSP